MQRLQRYILSQLLGPFIFFMLTLSGVIWLSQSLRYVDLIINKGLSAGYFVLVTMLILPSVFNIILPIGVFAAVLYSYNRLSNESEIVVMRSTGLSNWALARPALTLGVAATVAGFALSLYLMPAGQRALKDMTATLRTSLAHVLLQEGTFNTIGEDLTVYIRARQADGTLLGILVHDGRDRKNPSTIMAERGALVSSEEGPRFVLVNGNRQQVDRNQGQLSLLQFDRYTLDLSPYVQRESQRWLKPGERYLHELLWLDDDETDQANASRLQAEAHDRLSSPFYSVCFVLIALVAVLAGNYSRRGHGWRVFAAILAVVLVRASGLLLVSAAAKSVVFTPLIYLNVVAVIGICIYLLSRRSRAVPAVAASAGGHA